METYFAFSPVFVLRISQWVLQVAFLTRSQVLWERVNVVALQNYTARPYAISQCMVARRLPSGRLLCVWCLCCWKTWDSNWSHVILHPVISTFYIDTRCGYTCFVNTCSCSLPEATPNGNECCSCFPSLLCHVLFNFTFACVSVSRGSRKDDCMFIYLNSGLLSAWSLGISELQYFSAFSTRGCNRSPGHLYPSDNTLIYRYGSGMIEADWIGSGHIFMRQNLTLRLRLLWKCYIKTMRFRLQEVS
jgi:hypothetical protein